MGKAYIRSKQIRHLYISLFAYPLSLGIAVLCPLFHPMYIAWLYIYIGVKTYTCLTSLANKKDILDRKRLEHENDYPSHIMKSPQTRCRQDVKRVGFGIP